MPCAKYTAFQFPASKKQEGVEGGIARWMKLSKQHVMQSIRRNYINYKNPDHT